MILSDSLNHTFIVNGSSHDSSEIFKSLHGHRGHSGNLSTDGGLKARSAIEVISKHGVHRKQNVLEFKEAEP